MIINRQGLLDQISNSYGINRLQNKHDLTIVSFHKPLIYQSGITRVGIEVPFYRPVVDYNGQIMLTFKVNHGQSRFNHD